jgi:hypothetical protein
MADAGEQGSGVAMGDQPAEDQPAGGQPAGGQPMGGQPMGGQPSEDEMRAAYEAELNRITSSEMIVQTTVSLINIGGRRLGLTAPGGPSVDASSPPAERDLEQVRDAIDGARALMPILERRMPRELGPLRDAIAQLQMAYAREAQSGGGAGSTAASQPAEKPKPPVEQTPPGEQSTPAQKQAKPTDDEQQPRPGPAQASGRLWVPGR